MIKVAVAVIFDEEGRVLITRRSLDSPHGGLWEFPGGKLEDNELPSEALVREIKEEVNLDILGHRFIGEVSHCYGRKIVNLLVFVIDKYQGKAFCRESQMDLCWVHISELSAYKFPEANVQVIDLIRKDCDTLEGAIGQIQEGFN